MKVVNEYGFLVEQQDLHTTNSKDTKRQESQWIQWLQQPNKTTKTKMRRMSRNGVPNSLRAQVWSKLAQVDQLKQPGLFQHLIQVQGSPLFEVIERDLHRCFPNHILFQQENGIGQQHLRLVLRAYATYNPEVGYCQGMGFLTGLILMYMLPEDAFWLLTATINQIGHGFYDDTLSQIKVDAKSFMILLKSKNKRMHQLLKRQDIDPLLFITQWFITLYITILPWETVLRVWDMLFLDGIKVLFRVGLGIFKSIEKYCISHTSELLDFLLHIPHDPYLLPDRLIPICLKIDLGTKQVESIRSRQVLNKR